MSGKGSSDGGGGGRGGGGGARRRRRGGRGGGGGGGGEGEGGGARTSAGGGGGGAGRGGKRPRRQQPQPPRGDACFHFAKHGSCRLGEGCRFAHEAPPPPAAKDGGSGPTPTAAEDPPLRDDPMDASTPSPAGRAADAHAHAHPPLPDDPMEAVMAIVPPSGFVPMGMNPLMRPFQPLAAQRQRQQKQKDQQVQQQKQRQQQQQQQQQQVRQQQKPAVAVAVAPPKAADRQAESKPAAATATAAVNGDPKSKLAHITDHRFAELDISPESRRALSEVFKYEFMTKVQSETLPLILKRDERDCLAKAKTGTGKTLAFMIPTVERIRECLSTHGGSFDDVHCLVISPTRELAQQIGAETERLLTFHKPAMRRVAVCFGGTKKNADFKALKGKVPIVVATPGRLLDHLQNNGLAERMTNLDTLVLDEADQLLDMGFRPDIERILRLLQPSQTTRQTLLFSATIPNEVNHIAKIAMRPNYNFVDTVGKDEEQTHLHVRQELMVTSQENLLRDLFAVLEAHSTATAAPYKIIVFFTTARLTGFMAELFNSVSNKTGLKVLEMHSRKAQNHRERASEQFRKSASAVMFSSDVTARGMDYPDVTYVLQVGLTDKSQYVHRLGRTARAGKDGKGGLLLADYEEPHMAKRELADMPLEPASVPTSTRAAEAAAMALGRVERDKELRNSAEQAYRAWLGYYNSHLKKLKWDKPTLVRHANAWALENGLRQQPSLQKRTLGKMGLKGVPGLKIE